MAFKKNSVKVVRWRFRLLFGVANEAVKKSLYVKILNFC